MRCELKFLFIYQSKQKGVTYQYGCEMYLNTILVTYPVSEMRFMLCRLLLSVICN
jgi:hypothetical protein